MKTRAVRAAALAAMLAVCGGVGAYVSAQPGQPSEPARQNDPGRTNPSQPGKTNPSDPGRTNPGNQPGDRTNQPGDTNRYPQPADRAGQKHQRPFAFQNPGMESRFNESGRRLLALERRMADSNRDLMQKLSQARSMTGPAQQQAVLDLLQDILQEHQAMHGYLVQARTGWTGDLDASDSMQIDSDDAIRRNTTPGRPSTDATPRNPR